MLKTSSVWTAKQLLVAPQICNASSPTMKCYSTNCALVQNLLQVINNEHFEWQYLDLLYCKFLLLHLVPDAPVQLSCKITEAPFITVEWSPPPSNPYTYSIKKYILQSDIGKFCGVMA